MLPCILSPHSKNTHTDPTCVCVMYCYTFVFKSWILEFIGRKKPAVDRLNDICYNHCNTAKTLHNHTTYRSHVNKTHLQLGNTFSFFNLHQCSTLRNKCIALDNSSSLLKLIQLIECFTYFPNLFDFKFLNLHASILFLVTQTELLSVCAVWVLCVSWQLLQAYIPNTYLTHLCIKVKVCHITSNTTNKPYNLL